MLKPSFSKVCRVRMSWVIALAISLLGTPASAGTVIKPRFVLAVDTSGSMMWTSKLYVSPYVYYHSDGFSLGSPAVCGPTATSCTADADCLPAGTVDTCFDTPPGYCYSGTVTYPCVAGKCDCPNGSLCGTHPGVGKPMPYCYLTDGVMVHGDGSPAQPGCDIDGNGLYDDSRIYQAKGGLMDVISGFGSIEFALARFEQTEIATGTSCYVGTYLECATPGAYCSGRCSSCGITSGICVDCKSFAGDQSCNGATSPFGGGTVTCKSIVDFGSDSSSTINYRSTAAIGTCNGQVLVPFPISTDNYGEIMNWLDGVESGSNKELRAHGGTPLGGILRATKTSAIDPAQASDAEKACRTYGVILLTDGVETCEALSAATAAAAALNAVGAKVYVIGFGLCPSGVSRVNCPAIRDLDAIASSGGTTQAIIANSQADISARIADILQKSFKSETCNCLDDNCNVAIDETFDTGVACSVGIGECKKTGVKVCDPTDPGKQKTVCCADTGNLCPASGAGCPLMPGTPSGEICDGKDNDCNGLIDDGIPGGCSCIGSTEVCDGKDNDCDSMTDEDPVAGKGTTCGSSKGVCTPGTYDCIGGMLKCIGGTGPMTEVCNGIDDNCNGATDETDPDAGKKCYPPATKGCDLVMDSCLGLCRFGSNVCEGGVLKCKFSQGPVAEKCNGLDDDCDGTVDNGFDVGTACDNGKIGACKRTGTKVCSPMGGTACTAPPASGTSETCNGMDDDCDGMTDEDTPLPGEGLPCGVGIGECMSGTTKCEGGMIVCKGGKGPMPEVCDGKDNNCNGLVDEMVPGEGMDCLCPGLDPSKVGVGECKGGKTVCKGKDGFGCEGCTFPGMEICNGKDDDCDGTTDTSAPCPGGFGCRSGECAPECKAGEFPCPAGQKCDKGYCVPEPCAGVDCGGRVCKDGKCVDPCADKKCTATQTCVDGVCHDCYTDGCPDPMEHCELGVCKKDPCAGVICRVAEFCNNGVCVPACDTISCPAGQRCVAGKCQIDACAGVACAANEFCDPATGECKFNPCKTIMCSAGTTCVPKTGMCGPDPCESVFCNRDCLHCEVTPDGLADCVGPITCRIPPVTAQPTGPAGGGGCTTCAIGRGVSVPGHDARGLALLALLGSVLAARRRRVR